MKTIVILFTLLCIACVVAEVAAVIAADDEDSDEEDEDARQEMEFMGDHKAQSHEAGRTSKQGDR